MDWKSEAVRLDVEEALRPRVHRTLGIPLEWDAHVDRLAEQPAGPRNRLPILLIRLYRRLRPKAIGDRCCFEPSCSRYAELCFAAYGFVRALNLTLVRLRRCGRAGEGGLDLPDCCKGRDSG